MAKKKVTRKKKASKKKSAPRRKPAPKKKLASKKKPLRKRKSSRRSKQQVTNPVTATGRRGLGAASGGQSGDAQGLSRREDVDSESVEELLEEGQTFEAEAVAGVENAKDPDQEEVHTHEVPEDDVPPEYEDRDKL